MRENGQLNFSAQYNLISIVALMILKNNMTFDRKKYNEYR